MTCPQLLLVADSRLKIKAVRSVSFVFWEHVASFNPCRVSVLSMARTPGRLFHPYVTSYLTNTPRDDAAATELCSSGVPLVDLVIIELNRPRCQM